MRSQNERTTVVGVFEDRSQADRAIDELRRIGFKDEQIGYAARGSEPGEADAVEISPPAEGAATGLVTGGVLGGIVGAAAAGLIPGIGPVIAGGALASILGGAAIGATAGGLLGALAGLGIPEDDARYYQREFEAGRTIVTVQANGDYHDAEMALRTAGAHQVQVRAGGQTTPSATPNVEGYEKIDGAYRPTSDHYPSWDEAQPYIHSRWLDEFGSSGRRWSDDEAGYRYAHEMRGDPRYRDRDWADVEPEFGLAYPDWARERGYRREVDDPWAAIRDRVREGWEGSRAPRATR